MTTLTEIKYEQHEKTKIIWEDATCFGMGDDLFFDQTDNDVAQVRSLCSRCPIRPSCLFFGMTQDFGMWGGMTEQERRKLKAMKEKIKCDRCDGTMVIIRHSTFIAEVCGHCGVWWRR